jgi:hypothetical protein
MHLVGSAFASGNFMSQANDIVRSDVDAIKREGQIASEQLQRSRTSGHIASAAFFTLFFAITFAAPLLFGDRVLGDLGDTRFNTYVLEHVYQWLTGHPVQLFSPPFFYPYPFTLFFSDTHFGTVFIYAIYRLLGFSEYHSFALWFLTGYFLTLWASNFALARLNFGPFVAGVAASMFAFSLPSIAQMSHAQLAYRAGVPMAIYCLIRMFRRSDPFAGLAALCWLFLQLLISVYLGIFLAMLMGAFAVSYLLFERRSPVVFINELLLNLRVGPFGIRRASLVWVTLLLACATGGLMAGYKYVSALYEFQRNWPEVSIFLPRPASYFFADHLPYWSRLPSFMQGTDLPGRHEHRMFIGIGAFVLFLLGVAATAFNRYDSVNKQVVRTLLLAAFMLIAIVTSVEGHTLFQYVYLLPGINSIRGMTRIILILAFPLSIVGAAGLTYLLQAQTFPPRAFGIVLAGVFFWEASVAERDTFNQGAEEARTDAMAVAARAAAGATERPILHLIGDPNAPEWASHIDAMVVSQRLGWPTVEGYSGFLLMNPFRTPNCGTALQHYAQFLEWSMQKGRPIGGTSPELFPQDLLKRTVVTGARQCPSTASSAGVLKYSSGPPPNEAAAAQVELDEVDLELTAKDFVGTVKIRNLSGDNIPAFSSGLVRLSWRFVTSENESSSAGWDTRQGISGDLAPGAETLNVIGAPLPAAPGSYRLQVSLVSEGRFWFHDRGMKILTFREPIIIPLR